MRIKITGCSELSYWYRNIVGQTLHARYDRTGEIVVICSHRAEFERTETVGYIDARDCEILPEQEASK
jgi:hypothetical protein